MNIGVMDIMNSIDFMRFLCIALVILFLILLTIANVKVFFTGGHIMIAGFIFIMLITSYLFIHGLLCKDFKANIIESDERYEVTQIANEKELYPNAKIISR